MESCGSEYFKAHGSEYGEVSGPPQSEKEYGSEYGQASKAWVRVSRVRNGMVLNMVKTQKYGSECQGKKSCFGSIANYIKQ